MAVNISKAKYVIFRTKGKKIDDNISPVTFNNNEMGVQNDPKKTFLYDKRNLLHNKLLCERLINDC